MPRIASQLSPLSRRPATFVACLAVLCVAWAFVIAPFGGPDEPGHFLRSAAMARGQLTGTKEQNPPDGILYWRTRVNLDPRFDSANAFPVCFRQAALEPACFFSFVAPNDATRPATIPVPIDVGLYPPAPYAVTAVGTVFGPRLWSLYAARLCNAAVGVLLLGSAYASARRRATGIGAVGLLLVTTPAVFFFAATVNPSGLELTGAIAAWYLLTELWGERHRTRRVGAQAAAALTVCALARPLGPLLVATIVACTFMASGLSLRAGLQHLRQRWLAMATVVAATVLSAVWYLTMFAPATHRDLAGDLHVSVADQIRQGIGFIPGLLRDAVGNFGWLDTPAPFLAWFPWVALFAAIAVIGLRRIPSGRVRFGASVALIAAGGVMFSALLQSYRLFHFPALQTRHYLPFALGMFIVLMDALAPLTANTQRLLVWSWAAAQSLCLAHAARRYLYGLATPAHTLAPGLAPWQPALPVWGMVAVGCAASVGIALAVQSAAGHDGALRDVAEDVHDHVGATSGVEHVQATATQA